LIGDIAFLLILNKLENCLSGVLAFTGKRINAFEANHEPEFSFEELIGVRYGNKSRHRIDQFVIEKDCVHSMQKRKLNFLFSYAVLIRSGFCGPHLISISGQMALDK